MQILQLNIPFIYKINVIYALFIFACAFISSLILIWFIKKYAFSLGLIDKPQERKLHTKNIATSGGIGIVLSVILAYFIGWYIVNVCFEQVWAKFFNVHQDFWDKCIIIVIGGIIIFFTGLFDDLYNLGPLTKLIIEISVIFFLIYNDIRITLFINNYLFSVVITTAWLVLIINAFNLLDNMDGLSAGVAFISGIIFLITAVQTNQWTIAFLLIGLLGGLLGFLCYNFPPASIFMGDSGSLFIGYMMGVLTVHTTFYQTTSIYPVALPILVLAVPLFDTLTVIWIRISAGSSIFKADKRHFSHRLLNLGMSPSQALLIIYLLTLVCGLSAILLYQIDLFGAILILIQLFLLLTLLHILEQSANEKD